MTKRTNALSGPQDFAAAFVSVGTRVAAKVRAHHPELDALPVKLVCIIGGGWHLIGDDVVLGEGTDQDLSEAAKLLTRAVVSELDVRDRGRLLARMESFDTELSGVRPPHFRVTLTLKGESWSLRVCAYANGATAAIGDLAGTLVLSVQAAA